VSEGRLTGLPDFVDVLAEVARHHGDVRALIGHSLGATAAAMAHAWKKLHVRRIVLVSPPSDLVGYSRRFARWHWMPETVRRSMQSAIEERFGLRWDELELPRVAPRLEAPALIIHDRGDPMVPWAQGASFAEQWRGARFMATEGLGHRRILQDPAVTQAAADFLQ
jgi:pimeloyl-ACP methyl ester carboxylesterase